MKVLLCSLLLLGSLAHADIDVEASGPNSQGIFTVQGAFDVEASTSVAWGVLTDFSHMAEFLYPSVTESRVKEQEDNRIYVNQTFVAKVLFFDHSANVLFKVMVSPELGSIEFEDVLHEDFDLCKGFWRVLPTPYGSEITYSTQLIPKQNGPNFIVRRISRKM